MLADDLGRRVEGVIPPLVEDAGEISVVIRVPSELVDTEDTADAERV